MAKVTSDWSTRRAKISCCMRRSWRGHQLTIPRRCRQGMVGKAKLLIAGTARPVGVGLIIAVVGCTGVKTTNLPKGQKGYVVSCSGLTKTWNACLIRAGRLCGDRGYVIAQSDEVERWMMLSCNAR
jgi:hypothetical protein